MKKFILEASQNSKKVFAALQNGTAKVILTDNKSDAVVFDQRDNMMIKKMYYSTVLGLNFEVVEI